MADIAVLIESDDRGVKPANFGGSSFRLSPLRSTRYIFRDAGHRSGPSVR